MAFVFALPTCVFFAAVPLFAGGAFLVVTRPFAEAALAVATFLVVVIFLVAAAAFLVVATFFGLAFLVRAALAAECFVVATLVVAADFVLAEPALFFGAALFFIAAFFAAATCFALGALLVVAFAALPRPCWVVGFADLLERLLVALAINTQMLCRGRRRLLDRLGVVSPLDKTLNARNSRLLVRCPKREGLHHPETARVWPVLQKVSDGHVNRYGDAMDITIARRFLCLLASFGCGSISPENLGIL